MTKHKVIFKDRIYIPKTIVDKDRLKQDYYIQLYKDDQCKRCPVFEDRHSDTCDECPAYLGLFQFYNKKKFNGETHYGIPVGRRKVYKKVIKRKFRERVKEKDLRTSIKFKHKIKFTGTYRNKEQEKAVNAVAKHGYGILKSAARTGKCVVGDTVVNTNLGLFKIKDLVNTFLKSTESKDILKEKIYVETEKGFNQISHVHKRVTKSTYKIITNHGMLEVTPEHPILVLDKNLKLIWLRADEIKEGQYVCRVKESGSYQNQTNNILLSELSGYLTANANYIIKGKHKSATSNTVKFCSNNTEVLDRVTYLYDILNINYKMYTEYGLNYISTTNNTIQEELKNYGLSFSLASKKEVPVKVLQGSIEERIAFLKAYSLCDGYFPKTPSDSIEYCSASKNLIIQLQYMLKTLGITSKFSRRKSWARNSKTPNKKIYYYLFVSGTFRNKLTSVLGLDYVYSDSKSVDFIYPYVGKYLTKTLTKFMQNSRYYNKYNEIVKVSDITSSELYKIKQSDLTTANTLSGINCEVLKTFSTKLANRISTIQNFEVSKVIKIKKINKKTEVFDLTVPETSSFIANGFVCHNTVMETAAAIKMGERTLILAAQTDWLDGFMETIKGSSTQKALTNVPKIEKKKGYPIAVFGKTYKDFANPNHDIVLATYQTFLSPKGKLLLKKIKNLFGNVIIDEVDGVGAEGFLKVVNSFESKFRHGCTGTVERKDSKHIMTDYVVGPVIHETTIEVLKPTVSFIETGIRIKHEYKVLAYAYRALESNKKRNDLILDWLAHDLKQGHHIMIPVATVKTCLELVKRINEKHGKNTAVAFTASQFRSKELRKKIIDDARKGKYKVIVGIRRILQRGINIPLLSCLYEVTPISNVPNQTQEVNRVLTPMDGKPDPIIRHFLDDFGFARGCLNTSLYRVYVPLKFNIPKDDYLRGKKYTQKGSIDIFTMKPNSKGMADIVKEKKRKIGNLI